MGKWQIDALARQHLMCLVEGAPNLGRAGKTALGGKSARTLASVERAEVYLKLETGPTPTA